MPLPSLVNSDDLEEFEGSPFEGSTLAAGEAAVRSAARWHIAPSVTETLLLDCDGGTRLVLPSLYVTAISEVRDVSCETPVVITDYRWSSKGILSRRCGWWPCGLATVEVDLTHGYEECPADLWPSIATACLQASTDGRIAARTRGPFSDTYRNPETDPVLERYSLPSRP